MMGTLLLSARLASPDLYDHHITGNIPCQKRTYSITREQVLSEERTCSIAREQVLS